MSENGRTNKNNSGWARVVCACKHGWGDQLCFYYRLGGRESPPVWLTLGRYPDMSLATARRMRDQCREWLAENLDPRRQIKLAAEKLCNQ